MKGKQEAKKTRRAPPREGPPVEGTRPRSARTVAAGGPSTRDDGALGRLLNQWTAYFEVRSVTAHEIDLVRPTHQNGWLRPQIEAKLAALHPRCPDHHRLRHLVTLSLDLLTAVDSGQFDPGPDWVHVEPWLLRALAYFVKEGDAIPDHLPEGLDDDMREFEGLADRASGLFLRFQLGRPR